MDSQESIDGCVDDLGVLHGRHVARVGDFDELCAGMACAMAFISAVGEIWSSLPQRTSVGMSMLGRSCVQSGRSARPRSVAAMLTGLLRRIIFRKSETTPGRRSAVLEDTRRGSMTSTAACAPSVSTSCASFLRPAACAGESADAFVSQRRPAP